MVKTLGVMSSAYYLVIFILCLELGVNIVLGKVNYEGARVVKKEERTPVVETEFGSISAVDIEDGVGRHDYHLQFITLEPNSLFLPVILHADMVFYVHSGSGILSWTEGDENTKKVSLQRGDLYRLRSDTLFYLNSNLEPETPRLTIIAIFANPDEEQLQGPSVGPYSSVNDLVRSFDKPVLQAAFQVPEEVIEELTNVTDTPAIVHADDQESKRSGFREEEIMFINAMFGVQRFSKQAADNKKKHDKKKYTKTFNFFEEEPDFQNCNGWSKVVTKQDLRSLQGSQIGVYMVNLTKGSMMGPHWNPSTTEVSVVLEGEGMVQVVCPSRLTNKECKNTRVRVGKGDIFTVPRFHPTAQLSFNNGSLVFIGFSTTTTSKKNHPQFLAGKGSVLQTLDKSILGVAFNVSNTTVGQLLAAQNKSILLDCTSCAEEQEMVMEEETERGRREERKEREAGGGESAGRQEEEERREEERGRGEEEHERREKEQGRGEEERGRGEEEQERQEEKQGRGEEEQEGREEEWARGEEEMGGRGEEERAKRQRQEEEAGRRWKNVKLSINKQAEKGKSKRTA